MARMQSVIIGGAGVSAERPFLTDIEMVELFFFLSFFLFLFQAARSVRRMRLGARLAFRG